MRKLTPLIFIVLGCQSGTTPHSVNNDSTQQVGTAVPQKLLIDTVQHDDADIYKRIIPIEVLEIINRELPEWRIPDPSEFEAIYYNIYKKPNALINFNTGDFNGDQVIDYVVILRNTGKQIAGWIFLSDTSGLKPHKLTPDYPVEKFVNLWIEITPAGSTIADITLADTDEARTVTLQYPGVKIVEGERSATTYYWTEGRFEHLMTAD